MDGHLQQQDSPHWRWALVVLKVLPAVQLYQLELLQASIQHEELVVALEQ